MYEVKASSYSKPSSSAWVRFLKNSALGKPALDELNTLWVKWGYVNGVA
jgi:hypothetical protein